MGGGVGRWGGGEVGGEGIKLQHRQIPSCIRSQILTVTLATGYNCLKFIGEECSL